jgi:sodium transport system permease protein
MKITRSESASFEQWAVYLGTSLLLVAVLWAAAVWRYRQEKLAISA